jgi:hypothetical protein
MSTIEHYAGKVTAVGNSKGIRLDALFFKRHPEFDNDVEATVLGDGQVLLSSKKIKTVKKRTDDPVLQAFLKFLEKELVENPEQIVPADKAQLMRIKKLVVGVKAD